MKFEPSTRKRWSPGFRDGAEFCVAVSLMARTIGARARAVHACWAEPKPEAVRSRQRRNARPCGEHPRLEHDAGSTKAWMVGTSPTMTAELALPSRRDRVDLGQ